MQPEIPQRAAFALDLEPGDYLWCACGRSRSQPFCDGSHPGSGFEPLRFTIRPGRVRTHWLCGCKHTKQPPFCDASHNRLPREK
ncbi:CDGSH iron-sulfur domain-containing protein [Solimonas sp. K1W22B-7]|uniref:CDGSH iron-sulfur domain-containing protein n=1 Tax=Solimonas sp. K1W22B-7 TaxID=2303331 RepID=UPI000E3320D9|nr:CDGSH iron-sulfur domain-containing protein [Solimonas sp. K1W22B-7]AXQ31257.1 CDGSH iron-sulfur domain-containing protein [Solimonas sp. K1W22B-7]